ncbi:MAG: hypothetical protein JY451_06515 [Erythrobacter sp.]|nr:MAG: hypothetical protein JY451_06515 [Erythrobacter sp.]
MHEARRIWFINNAASGSNDVALLAECEKLCGQNALTIAHRTSFPEQELPTPDVLDAAGIDLVTIYAGDGTVNATLHALAGWSGAVLVLPGGTMNLFYHRLFGKAELAEVLMAVAAGEAQPRRPAIISAPCGNAYAGLLAGPGTAWNDVREAMRSKDPLQMASGAQAALAETLFGDMLACEEPPLGRRDGYPLLLLTPTEAGIVVEAYHAETASEYLEQAAALARRDFRNGPHERLGTARSLTLANVAGGNFGVLVDGEPCEVDGPTRFALVECDVHLLATVADA